MGISWPMKEWAMHWFTTRDIAHIAKPRFYTVIAQAKLRACSELQTQRTNCKHESIWLRGFFWNPVKTWTLLKIYVETPWTSTRISKTWCFGKGCPFQSRVSMSVFTKVQYLWMNIYCMAGTLGSLCTKVGLVQQRSLKKKCALPWYLHSQINFGGRC